MSSRASKELKGGAAHVKKQQDSFSVSPLGSSKGKVFHIDTIHISSKSDPYLDDKYDYGGIIIYAFKGKGEKEWCPIVETNHGIGYVVIMQTNSVKFEELQRAWPREPGKVHGIIFREAFEESFNKMNVVGEGFSIISGIFQTVSGVFNPSHGGNYHDESRKMHSVSAECVGKVVKKWKEAGGNFRARNYSVKSLFSPDNN